MKRAALLVPALALGLAACGGSRDGSTVAAPTPTAGSSSAAAPSSAAPQSSAPAAPAGAQVCPLQPQVVPGTSGVSADLSQKPVVPGNAAPAPSQVTVADVVVGTGAEATTLSSVETKYVGALYTSGEEFDSSWSRGPEETIPFTVCSTGVIPGFAIAPLGMKVGGRRVVTIPSQYGYGAQGSPPTIPGGADLVFVIDLVKVTPPAG